MLLFNGENIIDNNRYRTIFIYRIKDLSKILVTTIDIVYSLSNQSYTLKFMYHIISNLDYIYTVLMKRFNIDIVDKIMNQLIINNPKMFNINYKLNISLATTIRYSPKTHNYQAILNYNSNKLSRTLNIIGHQYLLVMEMIQLLVTDNVTRLLNLNKPFSIEDIGKLEHPLITVIN